jgi:DNA-binding transcriptional LysR family regulator
VRGVVRLTASEVIGAEVMPTIIAGLREKHPDLKVELVLTNRVQDLLHREADIAVRMMPPQQKQLIARRVGHIELGLHASRQYVERHGKPASIRELSRHALIGFDQPTAFIRSAAERMPALTGKPSRCARTAILLSWLSFGRGPESASARYR